MSTQMQIMRSDHNEFRIWITTLWIIRASAFTLASLPHQDSHNGVVVVAIQSSKELAMKKGRSLLTQLGPWLSYQALQPSFFPRG